ncbi:hypothetical protein HDU67_006622 [Dinochytrium kinnereticum]|nr:hypothetical protein HDU67_006622 [Dinochytrium kinnereticum]
MHLPHFIQQEMELEAKDYFEKKHINQIMEPDDPLAFIEDCVQRLKKGEVLAGKSRIQWDLFIPSPAKEATMKRKEAHRRVGFERGGKKSHNTPVVPILPPVKGAFIMPDAKPLLKSQGPSNTQLLKQREPLPALAKVAPSAVDAPPPVAMAPEINHPNIIFVLGGPGSGKGTQCARLAEEFNFAHLSTGDLLRAELEKGSDIGRQCGELMKEGKIVPMSIMIGLLKKEMLERIDTPGFLIDGFPRALDQAFEFERVIGKCKTVLYFSCPLNILEQRLLERGKTSGRADDNIETIKKRFKTFEEQSMPVVDFYSVDGRVVQISSTAPIDEVYEQARSPFLTEDQRKSKAARVPLPPIASAALPPSRARTAEVKAVSPPANVRAKTPLPEIAPLRSASTAKESLGTGGAWKNIIFVLGGPGCGKGTQCVRLAKEFNLTHLSAGDLLRAEVASGSDRAKELDALMKEGKIVPMEVTISLLQEAMERESSSSGFLIDGFPRQLDQAKAFEATVAPCRFVLFFDCPEDILETRLLKRGETSGRADDNIVTIKKRFKTFVDTSMPVVEYFRRVGKCVTISSVPPPNEVYEEAQSYFSDATKASTLPIIHKNLIFVLGGPGSGKGTQCVRLAKEFKFAHLSTGDLLRAELDKGSDIGKRCGDLMKEGKIVPMDIVIGLLRSAIIENIDAPGILIDGFPRAVDQAQSFEQTIAKPNRVIFFNCPLETLESRLLERGKTSGRADDNLETIRKRFQTFEEQSLPVVEHYGDDVVRIESTGPVDEVYGQVKSVFESADSRPFDGENIVFVLGGPGSGKGTQCDILVQDLHFAHLSTGDLLRDEVKKGSELGQELDAIMKEGKLIPLDVTIRLLVAAMEERRGKHPGYLIDGFPRNMEQAIEVQNRKFLTRADSTPLSPQFEKSIGRCKFVLFFDAPNDVLTTRLLKRGETSGRADDNLESIKKRLDTFQEASLPVIGHFEKDGRVRRVEAIGDVDSITKATLDCFKEIVNQ